MKKVVLLYSRANEPVTAALLQEYAHHPKFIAIHAEQLLSAFTINDEIINGVPTIEWTLGDIVVRNDSDTLLVNRLMEISEDWFSEFDPEDQKYAKDEFIAYLSFAIESFPIKTANVGYLGLAGNHYPLPVLWQKINLEYPDILTPEYFFGPPHLSTLCPTPNRGSGNVIAQNVVVQKDLFDHVRWKANEPTPTSHDQPSVFQVACPAGQPLLVYTASERQSLSLPQAGRSVPAAVQTKVLDAARTLTQSLNCFYTQSLFFYDDHEIYFASISPYIFSPNTHPEFHSVTVESIQNHLGVQS